MIGCSLPEGPKGDAGKSGVSLLNTYSGTFYAENNSSNDLELTIPEIKGKPGTTYVMVYWAFSSSPEIWSLCSDGWLDSADYGTMASISWTYGTVWIDGFPPGDTYRYKVDVYGISQ